MGKHHPTYNQCISPLSALRDVEILAPTFLEYWAVRCMLPSARVSWVGVRLARWQAPYQSTGVIVCGLAGALASGLAPGTVLIPDRVGLADGRIMRCDPAFVQALVTAASILRLRPETGPLLTAQALMVGVSRHDWARRGFIAADMETGLLAERNLRVATIRVVLDGPEHDISADWLRPTRAWLQPSLWQELRWLSRMAPRYALRAAHVLKVGLSVGTGGEFVG
ncbi:MAG TPA: hypothetical protein VFU49_21035 [Ktedonobacteraceae bacterium]|nr:hypothetical protein [Ktedonobacteraceae bacterium]